MIDKEIEEEMSELEEELKQKLRIKGDPVEPFMKIIREYH